VLNYIIFRTRFRGHQRNIIPGHLCIYSYTTAEMTLHCVKLENSGHWCMEICPTSSYEKQFSAAVSHPREHKPKNQASASLLNKFPLLPPLSDRCKLTGKYLRHQSESSMPETQQFAQFFAHSELAILTFFSLTALTNSPSTVCAVRGSYSDVVL